MLLVIKLYVIFGILPRTGDQWHRSTDHSLESTELGSTTSRPMRFQLAFYMLLKILLLDRRQKFSASQCVEKTDCKWREHWPVTTMFLKCLTKICGTI